MRTCKIIAAVVIWFIFWFAEESLYLISRLLSTDIPFSLSLDVFFGIYSLWIISIAAIGIIIWRFTINDFSFLKIKNKKWLLLYIVPVILSIVLFIWGNGLNINRVLYAASMFSTTFIGQDVLTFGFLQTYLGKVIDKKLAALVTGISFFIGHLTFNLSYYTLLITVAAVLFSYLRYKTKNIYLLNIVHVSFLLLPILA